jgi:beta-galactosidase
MMEIARRVRLFSLKQILFSLVFTDLVSASVAQDDQSTLTGPGPVRYLSAPCYQPIDRSPEQIDRYIAIMKRAGFNVVRMGDPSWDSFEPSQGKFNFRMLDAIMDKIQNQRACRSTR